MELKIKFVKDGVLEDEAFYLVYCPKWSESRYAICKYWKHRNVFTTEVGQDISMKHIEGYAKL